MYCILMQISFKCLDIDFPAILQGTVYAIVISVVRRSSLDKNLENHFGYAAFSGGSLMPPA